MSQPPGLPRLSFGYIVLVGALLLGCTIAQALISSPILIGMAIEYPAVFDWAVLVFIGWVVLYSSDILRVARFTGWKPFLEMQDSMNGRDWIVVVSLVAIYLNSVVAIGAGIAFVLTSITGTPLLGLIIALAYANVDLRLGARWYSPGSLILLGILEFVHVFGAYRELTAGDLLESLQLRGQFPEYEARPL